MVGRTGFEPATSRFLGYISRALSLSRLSNQAELPAHVHIYENTYPSLYMHYKLYAIVCTPSSFFLTGLYKPSKTWFSINFSVLHDNFPSYKGGCRHAQDFPAFIWSPSGTRIEILFFDRGPSLRVYHDQIGVRADVYGSFFRVNVENLGR